MFFRHARKLWESACTGPHVVEHDQARREPQRHVDRDAQRHRHQHADHERRTRGADGGRIAARQAGEGCPHDEDERDHEDDPRHDIEDAEQHQPAGHPAERREELPHAKVAVALQFPAPDQHAGQEHREQQRNQDAHERQQAPADENQPEDDGHPQPRAGAPAEKIEARREPRPALAGLDGPPAVDELTPFGRSFDIGNLRKRGLIRVALAHGALPEILRNKWLRPLAAANSGTCPS